MTPRDRAQEGIASLKEAILEYLRRHPEGVQNSTIVRDLGLESDFEGQQKNYLSWSVLGLLVNERRVSHRRQGSRKLYFIAS
jgi:hypothetical protein